MDDLTAIHLRLLAIKEAKLERLQLLETELIDLKHEIAQVDEKLANWDKKHIALVEKIEKVKKVKTIRHTMDEMLAFIMSKDSCTRLELTEQFGFKDVRGASVVFAKLLKSGQISRIDKETVSSVNFSLNTGTKK